MLPVVALATFGAGCVPVPFIVPVPPLGYAVEGKPISKDAIVFIQPGTTTRADVVWELGAPDDSGEGTDDWISYTSWRHRGGVIGGLLIVMPGGGGGVGVARFCRRPRTLKIWFDAAGMVTRHELDQRESVCETTLSPV